MSWWIFNFKYLKIKYKLDQWRIIKIKKRLAILNESNKIITNIFECFSIGHHICSLRRPILDQKAHYFLQRNLLHCHQLLALRVFQPQYLKRLGCTQKILYTCRRLHRQGLPQHFPAFSSHVSASSNR